MSQNAGLRPGLALAVFTLIAACDEPVAPPIPDADPPEPQLALDPGPCAGLSTNLACVRSDLEAISHSAWSQSPDSWLTITEWTEGTSQGTLLDAEFCTYNGDFDPPLETCGLVVSTTGSGWIYKHPSAQQQHARWYKSMPAGTIEFIGTIPAPEITVTKFSRPHPDSTTCAQLTNYVECSGPGGFSAEFEITNVAWYTDGGLAVVRGTDPTTSTLQSTPGAVSFLEGAGTASDPAVYSWSYSALRMPTGSLQTGELAIAFREFKPNTDNPIDTAVAYVPIVNPSAATLALEAVPPAVIESQSVTFTASAPGAAVLEITGWAWTPDVAPGQTAACSAGQHSCAIPVYESGTMQVQAKADGVAQTAQIHVDVYCGLTGDPILDDLSVRQQLFDFLKQSGAYNSDPNARKEIGGWIYRKPDGTYELRPGQNTGQTPCSTTTGAPVLQGDTAVARWHTHPFFPFVDTLPSNCGSVAGGPAKPGGSSKDWGQLGPYGLAYPSEYIIDKEFFYRLDYGTPLAQQSNVPWSQQWMYQQCLLFDMTS